MKAKSHIAVGIAASFIINPLINIPLTTATIISAAFGSLIPDLDHPKSILNQKILPLKNKTTKIFIYCLFSIIILYINYLKFHSTILNLIGVILMMIGVSHHRGFTHSAVGIFIFYITVRLFTQTYGYVHEGMSFMVGYTSHLIADFCTDQGIELLYPLIDKNYRAPLRFSTGGGIEALLSTAAMVFIGYNLINILC